MSKKTIKTALKQMTTTPTYPMDVAESRSYGADVLERRIRDVLYLFTLSSFLLSLILASVFLLIDQE